MPREGGREGERERASDTSSTHTLSCTLAHSRPDTAPVFALTIATVTGWFGPPSAYSPPSPIFPSVAHFSTNTASRKKKASTSDNSGGVGRPHHEGHPEHDMHMGHGSPGRVASAHAHTCAHERAVTASPAPRLCGTWGPREPAVSTAPSCDNVPRTMAACPRVRIRRQRDIDGS